MHTLDSSHYGYLAQEVIPGYSPTPSPPYSPFTQTEAFFTFPSSAANYSNEVTCSANVTVTLNMLQFIILFKGA